MFKGSKKHHLYVFIFSFKRMSYSALETAVACQRTEPSLGRYEYKQKMSGECSNCSKILEFVNFFLQFPRFSKILFDV